MALEQPVNGSQRSHDSLFSHWSISSTERRIVTGKPSFSNRANHTRWIGRSRPVFVLSSTNRIRPPGSSTMRSGIPAMVGNSLIATPSTRRTRSARCRSIEDSRTVGLDPVVAWGAGDDVDRLAVIQLDEHPTLGGLTDDASAELRDDPLTDVEQVPS